MFGRPEVCSRAQQLNVAVVRATSAIFFSVVVSRFVVVVVVASSSQSRRATHVTLSRREREQSESERWRRKNLQGGNDGWTCECVSVGMCHVCRVCIT